MERTFSDIHTVDSIEKRIYLLLLCSAFYHFYNPIFGSVIVMLLELSVVWLIASGPLQHSYKYDDKFRLLVVVGLLLSVSSAMFIYRYHTEFKVVFSLLRQLTNISHLFFFYFVFRYITRTHYVPDFSPLAYSCVFAVGLVFIDANLNLSGVDYDNGEHRLVVSSNIRHFGHIIMLGCLYSSVKLLTEKRQLSLIVLTGITFATLVWLGGRGALLSYAITLLLAIGILKRTYRLVRQRVILLFSILALSLFVSAPLNIYSWNGLNRWVYSDAQEMSLNSLSSGRIELWKKSWALIQDRPVLGHGTESYFFEAKAKYRHPHNFILQFLVEYGVVGLAMALAGLAYLCYLGLANTLRECNGINLFCLASVVSLIIHGLVSGTLFYSPPLLVLCIAAAYICAERSRQSRIK
ncbi:O-antigen ligase family protein [Vibrio hepatarius]|uniref:O-antigen ligase family protein n=1 Tax=Vibrio hepatarius TaxID=171383 RepID=UPI00142E38CE|nr:O-antigen ligase family protein [Vibrio hepatarius]NIY82711.1 O-antigen ligase family protein [Vibrio hepatarius]NVJ58554.1 O-antigen ligase family protein [Vibrionaceae bacterium]